MLQRTGASFRPMLWLVATGVFMQMLDTTIVNTALPAMAASLGESPLRMQAVVISYALTVAMLIPASGWLSDRLGTRRVFIAAVALFTLGSLACAGSRRLNELVAARVLQGLGGAMLLPVGRLAVLRVVPRADFLAAMSFVTLPGLIGPLVGPTLGGWLVQAASWHWIFLINLPLGVAGSVAAFRWMPDLRQTVPRFDLLGYGLLAFGMVAVSLSLDLLSDRRPRHGVVLVLLVFGLASLAAYWLHAARTTRPLFPLALFKVHTFSVGLLGNLFSRIGSSGMPYLIPLLMQVAMRYSPMHAGMMMIPTAAAGMFSKRIVVPLVRAARLPARAGRQHAAGGRDDGDFCARAARPGSVAARGAVCLLRLRQFIAIHRDEYAGAARSDRRGRQRREQPALDGDDAGDEPRRRRRGRIAGRVRRRRRRSRARSHLRRVPLDVRLRRPSDDGVGGHLRAARADASHSEGDGAGGGPGLTNTGGLRNP
jgi:MFS family permease